MVSGAAGRGGGGGASLGRDGGDTLVRVWRGKPARRLLTAIRSSLLYASYRCGHRCGHPCGHTSRAVVTTGHAMSDSSTDKRLVHGSVREGHQADSVEPREETQHGDHGHGTRRVGVVTDSA